MSPSHILNYSETGCYPSKVSARSPGQLDNIPPALDRKEPFLHLLTFCHLIVIV